VDRIEVHVAGVCVRAKGDHWQVLVAQRTSRRRLYPGRWECGGGQVRKGEDLAIAVKRQIWEEFGIEVEPIELLEHYAIPMPGQGVIPGIRFLCLAGEGRVRLNRREFARYQWVRFPVPKRLDWIEGVKKVLDTIGPKLRPKIPDAVGRRRLPRRKPPTSERRQRLFVAPQKVTVE
jgi:8-oxo-dGTP pyrophosphatase MutT (NUDIX family)